MYIEEKYATDMNLHNRGSPKKKINKKLSINLTCKQIDIFREVAINLCNVERKIKQ